MPYTAFFPVSKDIQPFASGLESLDAMLGGGLPRGGIVELYGPPGCGKSSLALHWCAQAQKVGASAAWVDADHTLSTDWAGQLGVRAGEIIAINADDGDAALSMLCELLRTFTIDFAVLDPVGALDAGEEADAVTQVLRRHLRKLRFAVERSGASLLLVNQTRQVGDRERSCGDLAIAINAAVRLRMEPLSRSSMRIRAEKNRTGEAFGECMLAWNGAKWSEVAARTCRMP